MGDKSKQIVGRAWRESVTGERRKIVVSLKAAVTPKNLGEALAILKSAHQLTKRYEDPENKPGVLSPGSYPDPAMM